MTHSFGKHDVVKREDLRLICPKSGTRVQGILVVRAQRNDQLIPVQRGPRVQLLGDKTNVTKGNLLQSDSDQSKNARGEKTDEKTNQEPPNGDLRTHVTPEAMGKRPLAVHSVRDY